MVSERRHGVERVLLQEARSEVSLADHKASMVLAALGIGFGALLGGFLAGDWDPSSLEGARQAAWWFGALLALSSVALAAAAVWPRFGVPKQPGQVTYWGEVAAYKTEEAFREAPDDRFGSIESRTQSQLWDLASIVATKYRLVQFAMGFGAAAIVCFLLPVLIGLA